MSNSEEQSKGSSELDRLLRVAGPRLEPPEDIEREIRAAVHREWRAVVSARSRRQRFTQLAIAAGLGAIALTAWLLNQAPSSEAVVVASIERSFEGGSIRSENPASERPLVASEMLRAGDSLSTGTNGGALIRLHSGILMRVDRDSVVQLASADDVALRAGALYVDAGLTPGVGSNLRVETPAGVVQHVGTQYDVRLVDSGTRIRVREGRVQFVAPGGARLVGDAGTQLTILADGQAVSEAIARGGTEWEWISRITSSFAIENRPLPEFLQWASREIGQEINYATPAARDEAATVRLRGSIEGLTPEAALAAVLSTTRLTSVERNGKVLIEERSPSN